MPQDLTVSMDDTGRLMWILDTGKDAAYSYVYISDASHRVKVLLGLMNYTPDLEGTTIRATETPDVCNGGFLYLLSLEGDATSIQSNEERSVSTLAVISTFMINHVPVIVHKDTGGLISQKIKTHHVSKITMTLVDRHLEPVLLISPMTVVMKIKSL
jgi:hypothetical protein